MELLYVCINTYYRGQTDYFPPGFPRRPIATIGIPGNPEGKILTKEETEEMETDMFEMIHSFERKWNERFKSKREEKICEKVGNNA